MSQTTLEDAIMRAVVDSQDKKHSWWGRKEITSDIKREVASIIASGLKIEITGGDHE
jgi:hypothetical protein